MIDLFEKFFHKRVVDARKEKKDVDARDIRIAACAILIEMANIDGKFSQSERENIIFALKGEYELGDEDAVSLIDAATDELKNSVDLWHFTNLINQNYSIEERLRIVETIWRIAYTDGKLDKYEDYLAHKVANLLRLTHKQLIEAKLKTLKGLGK
jgi:uncharacterized tellurite resistance protein B-like protein